MAGQRYEWWHWKGGINRGTYAVLGFLGFAIKYNLDRALALHYHLRWSLSNYWLPSVHITEPLVPTSPGQQFLTDLWLTAIPFIALGIFFTIKRLRDAGQPPWLAILSCIPVVNLLLFAVLCVQPSAVTDAKSLHHTSTDTSLWPRTRLGSAALGVGISAVIGVIFTWADLRLLGNYGVSLFLALPFVMGYLAVWLHCRTQPRDTRDVLVITSLCVFLAAAGIAAIAIEGLICLIMAAPIAWLLALLGGSLAFGIHNRPPAARPTAQTLGVFFVMLPLLFGAEHLSPPPVPHYKVHTSIEIAAPSEIVWKRLVAFPAMGAPDEWPFRLGISYPIEATIKGEGLTADRECYFSTGSFKEPILAWEPAKHFAFGVTEEPLLMKETSPYGDIHVRHLEDHDFQPERADFYLTPLPNGHTRLDGVTLYQNKMWPGAYWKLWTDAVVHRLHSRVFDHIKQLSEADARQLSSRTVAN